jgi:hypothetical protein
MSPSVIPPDLLLIQCGSSIHSPKVMADSREGEQASYPELLHTRAGGLFTLSFIITLATSLIAQVLEVRLNLLAVLLHQGFTCSGRDGECYSV